MTGQQFSLALIIPNCPHLTYYALPAENHYHCNRLYAAPDSMHMTHSLLRSRLNQKSPFRPSLPKRQPLNAMQAAVRMIAPWRPRHKRRFSIRDVQSSIVVSNSGTGAGCRPNRARCWLHNTQTHTHAGAQPSPPNNYRRGGRGHCVCRIAN